MSCNVFSLGLISSALQCKCWPCHVNRSFPSASSTTLVSAVLGFPYCGTQVFWVFWSECPTHWVPNLLWPLSSKLLKQSKLIGNTKEFPQVRTLSLLRSMHWKKKMRTRLTWYIDSVCVYSICIVMVHQNISKQCVIKYYKLHMYTHSHIYTHISAYHACTYQCKYHGILSLSLLPAYLIHTHWLLHMYIYIYIAPVFFIVSANIHII